MATAGAGTSDTPLIHWMAERSNENVSRQRSQAMVEEYGWSHFVARREASRL